MSHDLPPRASKDWENAFCLQYQAASIGAMFQGIVHNLNGVNQAFSLQAALLQSTFHKAAHLIDKAKKSQGSEGLTFLDELQKILSQRAEMAQQMDAKLDESQCIIQRALPLANLYESFTESSISINRIIKYELTILTSLPFFKHSVVKHTDLADDIPLLTHSFVEIHTILHAIILNAIEALEFCENPAISISSLYENNSVLLSISNSINSPTKISSEIFQPFYTTKEGHLGVGLYLADKYIQILHGDISFSEEPTSTNFYVRIPVSRP